MLSYSSCIVSRKLNKCVLKHFLSNVMNNEEFVERTHVDVDEDDRSVLGGEAPVLTFVSVTGLTQQESEWKEENSDQSQKKPSPGCLRTRGQQKHTEPDRRSPPGVTGSPVLPRTNTNGAALWPHQCSQ